MQEKWEKWQPIGDLEEKYNIDSIEYTLKEGFKIILSRSKILTYKYHDNAEKRVIVIFKDGIFAHRETDDSFTLFTVKMLKDIYGADFFGKWTFFKVYNSSYLNWLSEQSFGLSDIYSLTHYSLLTPNSILDIASDYEPIVKFIGP